MALLKESDAKTLKQMFDGLESKVRIILFTQEFERQYCSMTRELAEEVADLSGKLEVETYHFLKDPEQVKKYDIERIPAIVLEDEDGKDFGVRFYGVPAGYEFTSLIEDIMDIGNKKIDLAPQTLEKLKTLTKPVTIQVFVTPTCPYCPNAVRMAHKLAMASDMVKGVMVEASEFPDMAVKYSVKGVPKSVFNETLSLIGALPEPEFAKKTLEAGR